MHIYFHILQTIQSIRCVTLEQSWGQNQHLPLGKAYKDQGRFKKQLRLE